MKTYRCSEIAQLAHELTLAPLRHRFRQVAGITRAIELIDPAREYPYSFVCFHVTGYHTRRPDDLLLCGKNVVADLIELLDELTQPSPLPAAFAADRLHDIDALAARFKVSTKTISRWRLRGLAAAWYQSGEGAPRLAFRDRDVLSFVARHTELVRRGASFQLMSRSEKDGIIRRAREIVAAHGCGLHHATLLLSEETGRAIETIRYTLRRFDDENPAEALFNRSEQGQPVDQNRLIFEAAASGDSTRDLAARFERSESEIKRIITQVRVADLAAGPIAHIHNPIFDRPDAEKVVFGASTGSRSRLAEILGKKKTDPAEPLLDRIPADLPPYLQDLYRTPLLSADEEASLFRQMNFRLHRAELLRRRLIDGEKPSAMLPRIDEELARAGELKNRIVRANLRLVVSIAKRHAHGRRAADLFELVSDGNVALMRAVEKFDIGRGFRFSTYATWVVSRSFARSIPEQIVHEARFQTGCEEALAFAADSREQPSEEPALEPSVRGALAASLGRLETRERAIVECRYGIGDSKQALTLDEIGRRFGISKERVRQIELRAFGKLRAALAPRMSALLAG